jgi:hypothetical protein
MDTENIFYGKVKDLTIPKDEVGMELDKLIRIESNCHSVAKTKKLKLEQYKKDLQDAQNWAKSVKAHWHTKRAEPDYDGKVERQQVGAALDNVQVLSKRAGKAATEHSVAFKEYERARDASATYIYNNL